MPARKTPSTGSRPICPTLARGHRDQFIDRLSHHYDQWNYVHPFREGNGRTQRLFWNRVAADAGWQLDWRPVQGAVNDAACRAAAENRDFGPLRAMFDLVVLPQ
ncbi:MAG: Fic family protein [Pseudolysinimonas sp.]